MRIRESNDNVLTRSLSLGGRNVRRRIGVSIKRANGESRRTEEIEIGRYFANGLESRRSMKILRDASAGSFPVGKAFRGASVCVCVCVWRRGGKREDF